MAGFPRWALDAAAGIERLDEAVAEPLLSSDKYLLLLLRLEPGQVDPASILSQGRRLLAHAEALKKQAFFFSSSGTNGSSTVPANIPRRGQPRSFSRYHAASPRRDANYARSFLFEVPPCCVMIGRLTFASCACVCPAGIECPRSSRNTPTGVQVAEPFSDEAMLFTKELVLQREVSSSVEGGAFFLASLSLSHVYPSQV